ncbi:pilus assembly protein [Sphingopyxis indica]|uniref:pilus assembly protein n=1 Tax=Sphingopyxis indica TaxID=436663 RepID=UPI00293911CF|nr:pilus assembly protein [Sphingopyxis indica]WOF42954.1 pilus assembly protein [Sphingopyxis indica]
MRGTIIRRFRSGAGKLLRDQRGNALMLTAAAVVPLVGIVGSAVDIGRAYMTQLRLQQACDAGVLAGRRAMAGGTYTDAAEAEANKMFNFNFPDGIYGSSGISFASETSGKSNVVGVASATLPTALMYIFGKDAFNLSVNCGAKLEISNVDVMMVLDVTGSMAWTNDGDTDSKIVGLRAAAKSFFATLAGADIGDGQLRFGVVPYSATVNVGEILRKADSSWLSQSALLPSRTGIGWRDVEECGWQGPKWNRQWVCETKSRYFYRYEDRSFAVGSLAPGGQITANTGTNGGNVTATWSGCIIERKTTPFGPSETAPDDAFDMDIDMVPTSDEATKWQLYIPGLTYDRGQVAPLETKSTLNDMNGRSACPYKAMKLKKVVDSAAAGSETEVDQAGFDSYIDKLQPTGQTYHDVGMAWGARLISPNGLFASENVDASGRPIDRHIVFMTDGQMDTRLDYLSHQGVEASMSRTGATDKNDSDDRHNNRFLQLCERAREKGITIWVVSFGIDSNAQLDSCASSGAAFAAKNTAQLTEQFQSIARQISRLRLSK